MKKYSTILWVFMLFLVFSCGKERSQGVDTEASVVGVWEAEKIVIDGSVTSDAVPIPVPFNQERSTVCTKQSRMTLNDDQSGALILMDDFSGTCSEILSQEFTYSYDKSANTLELSESGVSQSAVVKELSNTDLVLERELESFQVQGGAFSGKITVYFRK